MKEETDAGAEGEGERRAEMCDIFACLNYNVKRERSYILQVLFMASVALVPLLRLRRRLHRRLLRLPPPSRLPVGRQHRVPRQVRLPRIACTRWVTHGEPALRNSHPQSSGAENEFLVVHNGVITNHEVLKQTLIRHGFTFESDTDNEVIPKLAKYVFDKSNEYSGDTTVTFSLVMLEVIRQLEGAYALIFKSRHYPNELIACKHGSPLLLGVNELTEESSKGSFFHDDKYPLQIGNPRELFLSSDANALVEHTRKVLVIEDGEVVHLKLNSSFVLFHWRGKLIYGGTCKAKTVLLGGLKDHLKAIRRAQGLFLLVVVQVIMLL